MLALHEFALEIDPCFSPLGPLGSTADPSAIWLVPATRQVLDAMADLFLALDRDLNVVFVNRALEEASRERYGSLVGRNQWDVWPDMRGTVVEESFQKALAAGLPVHFEYRYPRTEAWVDVDVFPSGDYLHVYFRDVTAKKKAEKELEGREAELRAMVDGFPQIAWAADASRVPTYLNRRWYEYTGVEPTGAFAPRSAMHPDDLEAAMALLGQGEGRSVEFETRLRRRDGEYRWHLVRSVPRHGADGRLVGYFGTSTDVHELREAREALREREALSRSVLTTAVEGMAVFAPDGSILLRNEAFDRLHYGSRQPSFTAVGEFIPVFELFEADGTPLPPERWPVTRALRGERVEGLDLRVRRADYEHEFWGRYSAAPVLDDDGHLRAVVLSVSDVSERMRTERDLREAQARTEGILASADIATWVLDVERGLVFADANLSQMYDVEARQGEGVPLDVYLSRIHPDDLGTVQERIGRAVQSSEAYDVEYRVVTKAGQRWVSARGRPKADENGRVTTFPGVVVDVTALKRAQSSIEDQLRTTRTIAENADSPLMLLDREGFTTYASPAFYRVTGYTPEDTRGKTAHELIHYRYPDGRPFPIEECPIDNAYWNLKPARNLELTFVRKDGTLFPVVAHVAPLTDERGRMQGGVLEFRDVTEERATEGSLRFLVDLEEALRPLGDADEIVAVAARMLGDHLGVDRCAYAEMEEDENHFTIQGNYTRADTSPIVGRHSMAAFGRQALDLHREGVTMVLRDVDRELPDAREREAFRLAKIGAVISVPLLKSGRFAAGMSVHQSSPRRWTESEIQLVEMVVDRCWASIERARAERAVKDSEARYRSLFETSPQPMWVYDTDTLEFLEVNDAAVRQYGYSREEFLSMTVGAIRPPEDLERLKEVISEGQGKPMTHYGGWRHRRKDGSELVAEIVSHPTEFGDRPARLVLAQDVTARLEIERALRESAAQYEQIAEGLPQMVWSAGPGGVRDYFNGRWLEYTGVGLEQSENPWLAVLHPEDRDRALGLWWRSIENGEPFQSQYRLRGRDGRYRWYLGRAIPLKNQAGEIVRWFGTCTDVHEQRTAQEALEITNEFSKTLAQDLDLGRIVQALCDASTQAVGAQFGSFFYNVVNEQGEALLLYTLSGAPIEAFERFGMPRATHVFGPTFRNEGIVRSDDITKDPRYGQFAPHHGMPAGHLPVVSYLAVPVVSRSGEVIGGLFFGHPQPAMFTQEHESIVSSFAAQAAVAMDNARLYERLAGMNQELEAKVEERTAELLSAVERLQGFTYHVSHDLRAPLRAISSTSHVVREDYGELLPEEAHELLTRQADAATRLGQLVDDLLKSSRLSRQEMVRHPVDVTALARDAAEEALSTHPYSKVTVEVEDGLHAEADPKLLRLAVLNLIENGVKYSPAGGTVRVGRIQDGAFFVSDEGIGIDPRWFHKIFEPFQRLHLDSEFSGTGIGLSNVRQVVERHGGEVWVESDLGKGSTFFFTLG